MEIKKGTLRPFFFQCLMAGFFTVLSLACFSMVYYFTSPETERLVEAFKSDSFGHWLGINFGDWGSAGLSLVFILTTIVASFIGFMAGIVAKVVYDRARDTFKSGIVS